MIDPAIGLLLCAAMALLFGSAAVYKLRDFRGFKEVFAAYEVAPGRSTLALTVPLAELAVAVGLLFDESRLYAIAMGVVLLLSYAAAIAINVRRGRTDLACGCGGPAAERRPIAAWMVWRNILLALVLAVELVPWSERPLGFTDAVTVVFGLLCLSMLYLSAEQLAR
jgi:hypothetical protein